MTPVELEKLIEDCMDGTKRSGGPQFGDHHLFIRAAAALSEMYMMIRKRDLGGTN